MNESTVTNYITQTFAGVETTTNFGYTFFFYGDDHTLPFATLISADNEYDRISNLDRPGVFRLNIGVSRQTFQSLFGTAKVDVGFGFLFITPFLGSTYTCLVPQKALLLRPHSYGVGFPKNHTRKTSFTVIWSKVAGNARQPSKG